jgi:hypothetical protein
MQGITSVCACGHPQEAHEHYRRGSDCGICGAVQCASFRAVKTTSPPVERAGEPATEGDEPAAAS